MMEREMSDQTLADYQRLTNSAGLVNLGRRTQIQLEGSDCVSFLNGFCTNDLQRLQGGQGCESFLTDVKGRILGHVYIYLHDGRVILDTAPDQAERILGHLDRYLITEDVQLSDQTSQIDTIFLGGPQAVRVLSELAVPHIPDLPWNHREVEISDTRLSVRRVTWTDSPGFQLAGSKQVMATVTEQLEVRQATACGIAAFNILRIEARTPVYGKDVSEENLPQEVDRDEQAISFTKGCYLGQETVARLDALGHVNRLLRRLVIDSESAPSPGLELHVDARSVGRVTSAAWSPKHAAWIALGYVRREHSAEGTKLQLANGTAVVA